MLTQISYKQFVEWMAFEALEPFSPERGDVRAASIVQAIANANRNTKKRRQPYPIRDFILRFGDVPKVREPQTWQQQKQLGKMYFMMFSGGKDNKPGPKRRKRSGT